jgi:hypothetical protein
MPKGLWEGLAGVGYIFSNYESFAPLVNYWP